MMSKEMGRVVVSLFILSFVVGCTAVRTYTEDKERMDQNLAQGNQGYLTGQSKEPVGQRKLTRKTYVAEVEVGFPYKKKKGSARPSGQEAVVAQTVQEPASEEETIWESASEVTMASVTSYTVEPNDTLQKISLKIFGTTKKWKKIYEANSDKLKSPNRIYAGQVLKIP